MNLKFRSNQFWLGVAGLRMSNSPAALGLFRLGQRAEQAFQIGRSGTAHQSVFGWLNATRMIQGHP